MKKVYQTVQITLEPLEYDETNYVHPNVSIMPDEWKPTVEEVLSLINFLPLREQAYMMMNLLTISGYHQKEVAESLNIPYPSYRNMMLLIRKKLKERGSYYKP